MANKLDDSLPSPDELRDALRAVVDPEAGMNIVDLGLIYRVAVENGVVVVDLTMTSPACPVGDIILEEVEAALRAALPAGTPTDVALVWEPPWEPAMMSDEARRHFNW
ncbi:MAG: metal-sulfur cluster assembly factor [Rhodocyclaceae bacterium]|nr:metal-sulfur cluster assembly factor [Rhodocyclaceae bacterium]